jgi:tetratricopeptide (TPR) repeat protein
MSEESNDFDIPQFDHIVLAVLWDDISGPSIISLYPLAYDDPESVALQIYLASVTVFGQHGQSQRIEFGVPLLSLGKNILARVAFDAWYDPSIRGEERPFFLAVIAKHDSANLLSTHLDTHIFTYLDYLKQEKELFNARVVWQKITDSIHEPPLKSNHFDQASLDSEYAISNALKDLQKASVAWQKLKDRSQLWVAMKVANRLEKIDDKSAGEAFLLSGSIFQASNNFQDAQTAFKQATEAFSRAHEFQKSGQAFCLAGKMAYQLGNNDQAIELFQSGAGWIKDIKSQASLQYDMALVYQDLLRYEEANGSFEKAIKLIEDIDKQEAAKFTSTYASKLMLQADKEKEENPTYALGLTRKSAEQRIKAAQFLKASDEGLEEAATSLMLASKIYFSLENEKKGINLVKDASSLFRQVGNFQSAIKAIYDGAQTVKEINCKISLLNDATSFIPEENDVESLNRLLGLIKYEIGKLEFERNHLTISKENLFQSKQLLTSAEATATEMIPVFLLNANISFNFESFEEAAGDFYSAYELLSDLEQTDSVKNQKTRVLTNALISWRRSSTIYHNAGLVSLENEKEREAIEYFTRSAAILIVWAENNELDSQVDIQKVLEKRVQKLKLKNDLFLLAESKHKVDAIISDLSTLIIR